MQASRLALLRRLCCGWGSASNLKSGVVDAALTIEDMQQRNYG